jgi:hypothetical protein
LLYYKDARVHCEVLNIRAGHQTSNPKALRLARRKPDPNPHHPNRATEAATEPSGPNSVSEPHLNPHDVPHPPQRKSSTDIEISTRPK